MSKSRVVSTVEQLQSAISDGAHAIEGVVAEHEVAIYADTTQVGWGS